MLIAAIIRNNEVIIPSGNDFIRNFDNKELFSDIEAQLDGDTVTLDLIKVNNDYCVNMVNIGFDCSVVKEACGVCGFYSFVHSGGVKGEISSVGQTHHTYSFFVNKALLCQTINGAP